MGAATPTPEVRVRRRVAKGPRRPTYLEAVDLDKVFMMVLTLAAEVSVLRDRIDTHEALGDQKVAVDTAAVEAYKVDATRHLIRDGHRDALLERVLRVVTEELDAAREEHASPKEKAS